MKQKRMIIVIIVTAIIGVTISLIIKLSVPKYKEEYTTELEDGTKVNISSKLSEKKIYNGLEFTNIKFTKKTSVTNLSAEVKNTTSSDIEEQMININVLDKSGNILTTFQGELEAIETGKTIIFNAGIVGDYINAYDIEIVAFE